MVLLGSFLIGGLDDRKGGGEALVRRMNFPDAVQVPVYEHPSRLPGGEALPGRSAVLGKATLEATVRDESHGTTAQPRQASQLAGQVTCFCTRLHIFLPRSPQASRLLLP